MASRVVPLFPLPRVWLFPYVVLPLYVFEERYRQMIEDSLDGPGRIVLGTVEQGASPGEIARYFQLYGGYIDPYINKQSPGGPFDSGFFFDSGIGPNGGDSPYMN